MRQARQGFVLSLAAAAFCTAPIAIGLAPGLDCTPIPNGDFEQGLEGWIVESFSDGFGDHDGTALASVVDLTLAGGDADVARLELAADAGWTPGGSLHASSIAIRRRAPMTGEVLQLKTGGAFEMILYGDGAVLYRAEVAVRDDQGAEWRGTLTEERFEAGLPCGYGAAAFAVQPAGIQSFDLAALGFQVGDAVEIEVLWTATVATTEMCDAVSLFGTLEVDDFAFCDGTVSPGEADPSFQPAAGLAPGPAR